MEHEKWDRISKFTKARLSGLRFYMGSMRGFRDRIIGLAPQESQDPTFQLTKN